MRQILANAHALAKPNRRVKPGAWAEPGLDTHPPGAGPAAGDRPSTDPRSTCAEFHVAQRRARSNWSARAMPGSDCVPDSGRAPGNQDNLWCLYVCRTRPDTATVVGDDASGPPQATILAAIYPNSFNPRTTIGYELAEVAISRRHQQRSTVITANLAFKQGGGIFPGAACVAALIDRFTENCHVMDVDADSWRQRKHRQD